MGRSTNSIIDYFRTSKHFSGRTERRIFNGEANWLGVVNFHHIQMSIVVSMQFFFNWQ